MCVTEKFGAAMDRPTDMHWAAINAVMRYLHHMKRVGVEILESQKRLLGLQLLQLFTVSNVSGGSSDCNSISGVVIAYNDTAVG